jgi:hypothetical protein
MPDLKQIVDATSPDWTSEERLKVISRLAALGASQTWSPSNGQRFEAILFLATKSSVFINTNRDVIGLLE